MIKRILKQSVDSYRFAFRFMLVASPLAFIPVLGEGFQHIVEVQLGMFTTGDGIVGATEYNKRLAAALVKIIAMFTTVLLLPRFFLHGCTIRDAFGATEKNRHALVLMVLGPAILIVFALFLGPIMTDLLVANGAPIPVDFVPFVPIGLLLLLSIPFHKKMVAGTPRAFADKPFTPEEQIKYSKSFNTDGFLILVIVVLPAIAVHYFLNTFAEGKSSMALYAILVLDSLVVGLIAVLIGAVVYVTYRAARMAVTE